MRTFTVIIMLFCAACATTTNGVDNIKMAEGYYAKGASYLEQKNYELALVEFQRAVQTDSKNKNAYYALGIVNDTQGKPKEAEQYYQEAISIDPNFSEAYNALGAVYSKQQRWKDALQSFNKALENKLYTTPNVPYLNIARVYMAQKDYDKAISAYRDSKRYVIYDQTVLELGMALLEAGRTKEALKELQEGVSLAPNNGNMRYGLALALLKDGNRKAALSEFKKTIELAPKSEAALKSKDYIKTLR